MRKEEDCNPNERYLFSNVILSNNTIVNYKNLCLERCKEKNKGKEYDKFINWVKKENEIALYTNFAYADIKIPKQFNCIFELGNPSNFILEEFTITQAIYEAFFPINTLEDGNRHIAILEFHNKVPKILNELHVAENNSLEVPNNSKTLGICHSNDFEEIKKKLK